MAAKPSARVEAFSDGVFAIAITLLILEIRVPHLPDGATNDALVQALLGLWPSLIAFLLSFVVLLIMWINHHEFMHLVRAIDGPFIFANGFLLLMVTFVPFPTAVLSRYLGTPAANIAVAAYCGTFALVSVAYNCLYLTAAHERRLIRPEVSDSDLKGIQRAYLLGLVVYILSVVVALRNATAGLLICSALWIFWIAMTYQQEEKPLHQI